MIPRDLLSAFPHRQFHTLPGLLYSWAALPISNPNACVPMQGGNLYHFYDGLWYDPAERRTHDLPCERRTRYRLSQTDTVRPPLLKGHFSQAKGWPHKRGSTVVLCLCTVMYWVVISCASLDMEFQCCSTKNGQNTAISRHRGNMIVDI